MFHVEHGDRRVRAPAILQIFMVDTGDEHLALQIVQQAAQSLSMSLIQLRRQVVHQIDALALFGLIQQMPLGDAQGAHHQLLLTAGQNLRGIVHPQPQAQIGALRASLGMSQLLVTGQGSGQYIGQRFVLVPATVVAEGQPSISTSSPSTCSNTGFRAWI